MNCFDHVETCIEIQCMTCHALKINAHPKTCLLRNASENACPYLMYYGVLQWVVLSCIESHWVSLSCIESHWVALSCVELCRFTSSWLIEVENYVSTYDFEVFLSVFAFFSKGDILGTMTGPGTIKITTCCVINKLWITLSRSLSSSSSSYLFW